MSIQFGGLATGLDTSSIIDQLMNIERQPLTRLEADKTWLNNRLKAFTELDTRLKAFSDSIKDLNYRDTLLKSSTTLGSEEFFTASASRPSPRHPCRLTERTRTSGRSSRSRQNRPHGTPPSRSTCVAPAASTRPA